MAGTDIRWTIVGAGAWGRALALCLHAAGNDVVMWKRAGPAELFVYSLPGCEGALGGGMCAKIAGACTQNGLRSIPVTDDLEQAVRPDRHLVMAVPAQAMREVAGRVMNRCEKGAFDVPSWTLACKGIEIVSGRLLGEVVMELHERHFGHTRQPTEPLALGVVGGPNLAHQVAQGVPSGMTLATQNETLKRAWIKGLADSWVKVQPWHDVVGVSLAGALKNVMAIGYGLITNLWARKAGGVNQTLASVTPSGDCHNLLATYLALADHEMRRWIAAWQGDPLTMTTFAGWADLLVSVWSGRNSQWGHMWGRSGSAASTSVLTEGVLTLQALTRLCAVGYLPCGAPVPASPLIQGIDAILQGRSPLDTWPDMIARAC